MAARGGGVVDLAHQRLDERTGGGIGLQLVRPGVEDHRQPVVGHVPHQLLPPGHGERRRRTHRDAGGLEGGDDRRHPRRGAAATPPAACSPAVTSP
ncbi:MAG: hypothetical protein R2699_00080 [Acidimicrobiales bacterium]